MLDSGAVKKYLATYAEPRYGTHWPFGSAIFDHVVVVPAFAENPDFIHDALRRHKKCSWLLIVVANAPLSASASQIVTTQALQRGALPGPLTPVDCGHNAAWIDHDRRRAVWLVDRVSGGLRLPDRQGVGLARKIGMDLALHAVAKGRITTAQIWCCDGDGQWPENYFEPRLATGESALTFSFEHIGPVASSAAQQVYDLRIRDYPAQLREANSPCAFQALGSAMVVSATHYARVRGCPRRAAGEDFHLLAKLAKVGTIRHCPEVTVALRARLSRRVPFGTGRGVAELAGVDDPWASPVFYSTMSFDILRAFLALVSRCLSGPAASADEASWHRHIHACLEDANAGSLDTEVLRPSEMWRALQRAREASPDVSTRLRHFHTAFDALQTLRLIHRLRDAGLANVSIRSLLRTNPARLRRAGMSDVVAATLDRE